MLMTMRISMMMMMMMETHVRRVRRRETIEGQVEKLLFEIRRIAGFLSQLIGGFKRRVGPQETVPVHVTKERMALHLGRASLTSESMLWLTM